MNIVALDPGYTETALVVWDLEAQRINKAAMFGNEDLLILLRNNPFSNRIICEMIGHYGTGMPAGKEVFETCVLIGRAKEATIMHGGTFTTVMRQSVKAHLCGNPRAKDGNVRQALIDRLGAPGRKKEPGQTFGISGDLWSALAVAIYAQDKNL